jgi:ribosome biogenesis protein ERB1
MKLVKAIKEGRILPYKPPEEREREEEEKEDAIYDLWQNEQPRPDDVMRVPAPKLAPPGYDMSYNPPPEYRQYFRVMMISIYCFENSMLTPLSAVPLENEKKEWEETEPEVSTIMFIISHGEKASLFPCLSSILSSLTRLQEREKEYLPQKFDSLRKVPAYGSFVKERFYRSLDLYLAPRTRKNRLNIDPSLLLPKLPKPEELRPFPTITSVEFIGHSGRVRSVAIDPTGKWLASGGDDGTVKLWELETGHEMASIKLSSDEPVEVVRWRPGKDASILSAAIAEDIYFIIPPEVAFNSKTSELNLDMHQASRDILDAGFGHATNGQQQITTADGAKKDPPAKWSRPGARLEEQGVLLKATVRSPVKVINWHRRGDFFCTVSPSGQRSSVAIHTLSKHLTQIPFRKVPGMPQTAQFHPSRPLFFVATQRTIRCYDLQRQELVKAIQPGARWISSFDIHPGGDNLVVGSYDRRLLWHDLELSARPYKTMRFHQEAIRTVRFHRSFPLFADASDDGTIQIFHGKVVNDLMEDATIVPVKMLKGHKIVNKLGVMDIDWHPFHPWIVSAGADGTCRLWA